MSKLDMNCSMEIPLIENINSTVTENSKDIFEFHKLDTILSPEKHYHQRDRLFAPLWCEAPWSLLVYY